MRSLITAATILVFVSLGAAYAQDATPTESLRRLREGNARFVADRPAARPTGADRLKQGRPVIAAVVSCSDARVVPELVFDVSLGELYVVRIEGNIADPAVVGSVEYAVESLRVPLVVVLGHDSCGAVSAAVDGKPVPGDRGWLIKQVKLGDKLPTEKEARLAAAVRHNAQAAAKDLELRSKMIYEEVTQKKVRVVAAVYSLKTGQVEWLGKDSKELSAPSKVGQPLPAPSLAERPALFPRLRALFQRWR